MVLWISIGEVPAMSRALLSSALLVDTRATGEEMLVRMTGLPPRWLAARPMYIGELIWISGCLRLVVKARTRDILVECGRVGGVDRYAEIGVECGCS